jgi:hypothetical protein
VNLLTAIEVAGLLTDEMVERELHRVLCMGAKHRSPFTGECRAAPNIAHGIRYWITSSAPPSEKEA